MYLVIISSSLKFQSRAYRRQWIQMLPCSCLNSRVDQQHHVANFSLLTHNAGIPASTNSQCLAIIAFAIHNPYILQSTELKATHHTVLLDKRQNSIYPNSNTENPILLLTTNFY